jgi:phosphomannomutase
MTTADPRAAAQQWLAADPDPDTRAELQALLDAGDAAELSLRFGPRLAFGTAGIRGPLGAGPTRMNRVMVRQVSAGIAARLRQEHPDGGVVVVGRDARHKSEAFASDAAGVLAAAGFDVRCFDRPVPTPLVAFAVRHLHAVAGIQITASHNPPADNGYKVYWRGGAQIVAPLDAEISAAIDVVDMAGVAVDEDVATASYDAILAAYRHSCLELALHPDVRDLRIAYTPLHGVARSVLTDVLEAAGFSDVRVVASQGEPDPDFPTVSFPNPEEPGALDLALALAAEVDADIVVANDPDGDRIAAAIPDGAGWRPLTGDEIGCLLAEYLLAGLEPGPTPVVATTVVSSQLLARIAAEHGAQHHETLTGFKWLAPVAALAEEAGQRFVLAYEQALGVMAGSEVRDKDGISAALVLADMAAHLKGQGRGVQDALDDLARRHGVHATTGRSLRLEGEDGPALVTTVLQRLRSAPPEEVDGVGVTAVADHIAGTRTLPDGTVQTLETPATDLVGLTLADGSRLQVRPSGTEPLLKFYVEVVEPVTDDDVRAARHRAAERLERLADAFLELARPA